jgi:Integrase core domain
MRAQCELLASQSMPRVLELAKYKQPPYLYPTEKGSQPFAIWAVDTIVGLKPPAPNGGTHVLVCVDPFSKWVELAVMPELDSSNTATWFYDEIICRYGVPSVVRTDQGREFCGDFHDLLTRVGARHRPIATMWPRANG